jgi:hypothetical protein
MKLRAGKPTYPLPATWRGDQRVKLKTGRQIDFDIDPIGEKYIESLKEVRGMPMYCVIEPKLRTISFYPVPDRDWEVEFVEEEAA